MVANVTINDVIDFALANRDGKAFHGWTRNEIGEALMLSMEQRALVVAFDTEGSIIGVCHGMVFAQEQTLHVSNCLIKSNCKGTFRYFLSYFDQVFPGFKLEGTRFDRLKHYDTNRLKRHLNNLT